MVGELFNKNVYPEAPRQWGGRRARLFLEQSLDQGVSAVGFKIFVHQARRWPSRSVWRYLKKERGIVVIHMVRANIVERIVSHELARKTGLWLDKGNGYGEALQISKPVSWWERKIASDIRQTERVRSIFGGHNYIRISYEELVAHWETITETLQLDLNVEPVTLQKKLSKQQMLPLKERIANFDAVARHFQGTAIENMFKGSQNE